MEKLLFGALLILVFNSCASTYKPINPDKINYRAGSANKDFGFLYTYDVLNRSGNKKYAKKESRQGIKVVAVKVVNHSSRSLVFGKDLKVHANGIPTFILEPKQIQQALKQNVAPYLLYLLLTPMKFNNGDSSTPVGFVVGPGLSLGNMAGASSANAKFLKELQSNFLNGRVIDPGQTVFGLIGIYDTGYNPLTLECETCDLI